MRPLLAGQNCMFCKQTHAFQELKRKEKMSDLIRVSTLLLGAPLRIQYRHDDFLIDVSGEPFSSAEEFIKSDFL